MSDKKLQPDYGARWCKVDDCCIIDSENNHIPVLPCHHPRLLLVKSIESDYQFCELCEARRERNDALEMERTYKARLASLEERIAELENLPKEWEGSGYSPQQMGRLVDAYHKMGKEFASLEARNAELADAWAEMHCCDDVKLDQPLAGAISELQKAREAAESRIASLEEQKARLEAALLEIAKHPHNAYYGGPIQDGDGNYYIGVTDGHRCAAKIALAALAASSLSPEPSGAPPEEPKP